MRQRPTGIRLPQSLLDQLDEAQGDYKYWDIMAELCSNIASDAISPSRHGRSGPHRPKISRKEARRQDREGKKQRKAEYFSSTATNSKRLAVSPHPELPPPKKRTVTEPPRPQILDLQSKKGLPGHSSTLRSNDTGHVASLRKSSSRSANRSTLPTLPRSRQEEDEDRYIALLEAKLTSGKKSKNGASYVKDIQNDGLGGE
jgi:nucleolar MIF4G domain-containing protein 1